MFNKRLLSEFKENKILVVGMVITQWLSLLANVLLIYTMSDFIMKVFNRQVESKDIYILAITAITVMASKNQL